MKKYPRVGIPRLLPCLALLLLTACASEPDAAHPMSELWRVGYVDHEVALNESTPLVRFSQDCRAMLPNTQTEGVRWVMLHYRRPPDEVFRVVPLASGQRLSESQTVYVKVDSCTQALEPR